MIGSSSARPPAPSPPGPRLLVVGTDVLLGASTPDAGEDGLPSGIARQAWDERGARAAVDVLRDADHSASSVIGRLASSRITSYDGIVVVLAARSVLAEARCARQDLPTGRAPQQDAPRVVVVLASHASDSGAAARAEIRVRTLAAALPSPSALIVLHVATAPEGGVHEPALVAATVVQALGLAGAGAALGAGSAVGREMAVDRSLRALRGRTSHLRRALVLALNSFDVPYAQLDLVSHGTVRSLASIGRSSDGLHRSLSAEAVRLDGPLLVADTHRAGRFADIPETRGEAAIRFYIGHPVRSGSGHAVGALCVLDTEPHDIEPGDDVIIRDLALLAEGELAALTDEA